MSAAGFRSAQFQCPDSGHWDRQLLTESQPVALRLMLPQNNLDPPHGIVHAACSLCRAGVQVLQCLFRGTSAAAQRGCLTYMIVHQGVSSTRKSGAPRCVVRRGRRGLRRLLVCLLGQYAAAGAGNHAAAPHGSTGCGVGDGPGQFCSSGTLFLGQRGLGML